MKHTNFRLTENVVEEVAIIVIGFKSLIERWAALQEPNINRKIQFALQVQNKIQSITQYNELQSTYADFGINVSVVKLLIEDQKNSICI